MDLFLVVVLLLVLSAPILAVILLKKNKQHKVEVEKLNHQNITLSHELSENQELLAQAIREHSELEGKAASLWQYEELHSAVLEAEKKLKQRIRLRETKLMKRNLKLQALF